MTVTRLKATNFRNLKNADITPTKGVNIFCGANAQGKTNLLEALWLFTGGRSFRGARDSEMVAFGQECAELSLFFTAGERDQQAQITVAGRRTATLNGVAAGRASKLAGRFCGVVFSPAHLSLIKDGPDNRRRFLDAAYCQLRPSYAQVLTAYQHTLTQRNALLRDHMFSKELLDIYDDRLALAGARLIRVRGTYLSHIAPLSQTIYDGLSRGHEQMELRYTVSGGFSWEAPHDEVQAALLEALTTTREVDRASGYTTVGPHRDDFEVTVDGVSARTFGSQGQQRSAVLALKLAEAEALREVMDEPPVALLDDVMSELDEFRQDYLLNHMQGVQVFITCCEPSAVMRLAGGGRFSVENGVITAE